MSKKDAAIYRKAAELIDAGKEDRACWAIDYAGAGYRHSMTEARKNFTKDILCGEISTGNLYPESEFGREGWDSKKAMRARVIALLFVAAMAETGDL